jgi:hypothetical protein
MNNPLPPKGGSEELPKLKDLSNVKNENEQK